MADWAKIKAEYISGSSLRQLSEKYGVPKGTLSKKCWREKWEDARKRKGIKAESKIVDACATKEAKKACKVNDIADVLLEKLSEGVVGIKPTDFSLMMDAATILLRLKDSKKGLNELDLKEQEARIAKLRREAERDDTEKAVEIVMPPELRRFCQ
jgi:hypothetical protein